MKFRLLLTLWDIHGQQIKLFVDIPETYADKIKAFKLKASTVEIQECLPVIGVNKQINLDDIKES